ncbi:MAG: hypothetical protein RSC08_04560 [Oscillospiraceae bacterium]
MLICTLVAAVTVSVLTRPKDYVLAVDGSPVYPAEFQLILEETAGDREAAIDRLTTLRVTQALGTEVGVLPEPFTYEKLLTTMERENDKRAEQLENNQVVYGVQRFTPDLYYTYFMDKLTQALMEALSQSLLTITSQQVEDYYRAMPSYANVTGETIAYTLYDITAAQALSAQDYEGLCAQVRAQLAAGTYEDVTAAGVTYQAERRDFTPMTLRDFVKQSAQSEFLVGLDIGEVVGPFTLGGKTYLGQYNGFEKAAVLQENDRAVLENTLRTKAFGALIAQRAAAAEVRIGDQ